MVDIAPPSSAPAAGHSRRKVIIIAAIITAIVLVVGTTAGMLLLRRSAAPESSPISNQQLPGAEDGSQQTVEQPSGEDAFQVSTQPEAISTPEAPVNSTETLQRPTGNNLAIGIRYDRSITPLLAIDFIEYTSLNPSIQNFAPATGQPFSLVRVYDQNDNQIAEYPFTASSYVIAEQITADGLTGTVEQIDASVSYLVLPITRTRGVSRIEIRSNQGTVLDQEIISLLDIKQNVASESFWERLKLFTAGFVSGNRAAAQGACATTFRIVIINEASSDSDGVILGMLGTAESATAQMLASLPPWTDVASCVTITKRINRTPLGCFIDGVFPRCYDAGLIWGAAGQANAVIVVHPGASCPCGTVYTPGIMTIGTGTASMDLLIGHEFGHSVGGMVDEYTYKFGGGPPGYDGPNCFASITDCQDKADEIGLTLNCQVGCSQTFNVRPATLLMHNEFIHDYGPWETCLMWEKLGYLIGQTETPCKADDGDGLFYGGRR